MNAALKPMARPVGASFMREVYVDSGRVVGPGSD